MSQALYVTRYDSLQYGSRLIIEILHRVVLPVSEIQDTMEGLLHVHAGVRHYCGQLLQKLDFLLASHQPAGVL